MIPVAVKTCKPDSDVSTGEKFLEEACKLFSETDHNMCIFT